MKARILWLEHGVPRAGVLVQDDNGIEHSYIVKLREWRGIHGQDLYFILGDRMEIYDPDTRYLVNRALIAFQEC